MLIRCWMVLLGLWGLMPADPPLIIIGRNAVREALERDPTQLEKVCIQRGGQGLNRIRSLASRSGVPVQLLPQEGIRRLAGRVVHQGVLALRTAFSYVDYSVMLAEIAPNLDVVQKKCPRLLLLDGIQDPRNFGAIVRSASAFGVNGVIVCSHHMAPINAAMVKASSGTAVHMQIARVGRLADIIPELKERGYYVYGSATSRGHSVWEINWACPVALVIGSEGRGIFPDTERVCDHMVSIPLRGEVESLNASVAAGILLAVAYKVS